VLVGRDTEWALLSGLAKDLAAGRGAAVLVLGEPGVGKSALLGAGLADADQAGCLVLWAAGDELGRRFPLRPLLDGLVRAGLSADPRLADIDRLLRGEADASAGIGGGDAVGAAAERLLALVDELCAASPVALVVDDLHWADEATVHVWHRLARSVDQLPLLVAGAARPVPSRGDLAALREALGRSGGAVVELDPLSEPAVTRLVTELAGAPPGPALSRLAARAAGNPLYLTELIAALDRAGALRLHARFAEAPAEATPTSLSRAIARRLDFLTGPTLEMLRAASLMGATFDVSELATVLRRPAVALVDPLGEASAAGVLTDIGPTLAFRHPLIRDALYQGLPASLRQALQRDAARALAEAGAPADRVAAHLLDAGDAMDAWTLDWLTTAGPALVARAPAVAVDLLRAAADNAPPADPRRDTLAADLATALFQAGRLDDALEVARAALARASDPELAGRLWVTLARCLMMAGRLDEAALEIEHGLAAPGLSEVPRARLAVLAGTVAGRRSDVATAEAAATEALATVTMAQDPWACGHALNLIASLRHGSGRVQEAVKMYREALALVGDDPVLFELSLMLMSNMANALGDLDRLDEAGRAAREASRLAERAGNLLRLAATRAELVAIQYEAGQWDEALVEVESVPEHGDALPIAYLHGFAALIALHRDDAQGARRHLDQGAAAEVASRGWEAPYLLATALEHERAGRADQAHAMLAAHLTRAPAAVTSWDTDICGPDAVRLAVATADQSTARDVAGRVERLAADKDTPSGRAAVHYCRGLIDAAPALLDQAADAYRQAGRPLRLARALEAGAEAYARAGDTATARRLLTDAAANYAGLGCAWETARADALLRPLGVRRGRRTGHVGLRTGLESLTPTEVKVGQLVAEGLSNPQIADRLFISRRTVQIHVSHILTKLGLHSRVEIARQIISAKD